MSMVKDKKGETTGTDYLPNTAEIELQGIH
jgi:hypothetical protein